MQTFLYSIILLLYSIYANGQIENSNGFDTLGFINQIIKDKRSHIFLYRDIHPNTIAEIRKQILKAKFVRRMEDENGNNTSDSIVLSKFELNGLLQQLDAIQNFQWSEQACNYLNLDRLKIIGNDSTFNQYEGSIRYQIIPPLLFRNNEYCIFYFDYNCGPLCGHGQLVIYKKEKQGWKRWWSIFGWNS